MILPSHLSVRGGHLYIGEHDTVALAERFGTPLYVTSEDRVRENFRRLSGALSAHYGKVRVLYAAKANGNLAIFRTLASMGAGSDVFSAGEVALALAAGMRPELLLFNGSSKSPADLALAVDLRLVGEAELPLLEPGAQVGHHPGARVHGALHLRVEEAQRVAAGGLGAVHREIGVPQQVLGRLGAVHHPDLFEGDQQVRGVRAHDTRVGGLLGSVEGKLED
ncbi:MAG TPA: hypothetical protein PKJ93_02430, partial [Methanoculleus sp.]|nr:hypothetical protein [Methanoculleus sp.]